MTSCLRPNPNIALLETSHQLWSSLYTDPGSAHHALVVVMVILGIGLGIALLAICVYIATDSVTCDR